MDILAAPVKLTRDELLTDVYVHAGIDCSTSVAPLAQATIKAFNRYLAGLQSGAAIRFGLTKFSNASHHLAVGVPVDEVQPLTSKTYVADGGTALYDAAGEIIDLVDALDVPPAHVVVALFSDGDDQHSQKHNATAIRARIEATMRRSWRWIFFAAGEDAAGEARAIGILPAEIAQYDATGIATNEAFDKLARSTTRFVQAIEQRALPPSTFLEH